MQKTFKSYTMNDQHLFDTLISKSMEISLKGNEVRTKQETKGK